MSDHVATTLESVRLVGAGTYRKRDPDSDWLAERGDAVVWLDLSAAARREQAVDVVSAVDRPLAALGIDKTDIDREAVVETLGSPFSAGTETLAVFVHRGPESSLLAVDAWSIRVGALHDVVMTLRRAPSRLVATQAELEEPLFVWPPMSFRRAPASARGVANRIARECAASTREAALATRNSVGRALRGSSTADEMLGLAHVAFELQNGTRLAAASLPSAEAKGDAAYARKLLDATTAELEGLRQEARLLTDTLVARSQRDLADALLQGQERAEDERRQLDDLQKGAIVLSSVVLMPGLVATVFQVLTEPDDVSAALLFGLMIASGVLTFLALRLMTRRRAAEQQEKMRP